MAVQFQKFWVQTLIQAAVLLVAMAVAWGYQKSEVSSLKADVARIDTQGPSVLVGKIDALTVEVKYLHEMLKEERDARVHDTQSIGPRR